MKRLTLPLLLLSLAAMAWAIAATLARPPEMPQIQAGEKARTADPELRTRPPQ